MNSIEINISNYATNNNIYINIKRNTIIINNETKQIEQEKINELLRIIRTWKNNNNVQSKIIDAEKYIIKINTNTETEIIEGYGHLEKNYNLFKTWIGKIND